MTDRRSAWIKKGWVTGWCESAADAVDEAYHQHCPYTVNTPVSAQRPGGYIVCSCRCHVLAKEAAEATAAAAPKRQVKRTPRATSSPPTSPAGRP